ncbi:MAG: prolyl oligopeptidase family serine peptidase [Alphaproteobacteria bacterium]|nr:prolyl oligopeptidase family serine peptidase [Alphaproteobacteria bacterium]
MLIMAVAAIIISKRSLLEKNEDPSSKIFYNRAETKFLEKATGPEALEWAKSRTEKTQEYIRKQPLYADIKANIEKIFYDKNKLTVGMIRNSYVYNFWLDDKNPQGLWRRTPLSEYAKDSPTWETLIDFDELSKQMGKKIVFHGIHILTHTSSKFLIGLSFGGNDETNFKEWSLETKQFVENGFSSKNTKGEWIGGKITDGIWVTDDTILCNLPLNPSDVTESLYPATLYLWKRGEEIEKAKQIFSIPKDYIHIITTRLLLKDIHPSLFYIAALKDFYNSDKYLMDGSFKPQLIQMPSDATLQGSFKEQVFFFLNSDWNVGKDYKKGSLVSMHWTDLLKEDKDKTTLQIIYTQQSDESFDFLQITNNTVFLSIFKNINSKLYTFTLEQGKWTKLQPVTLANENALIGLAADPQEHEALMTFQNMLTPPSVYIWGQEKEFKQIRKPIHEFDSQNYVAEQRFAKSFDGQKIPYFIAYKKGLKLDGKNPTILTAYGGFQQINFPYYSRLINEVWLQKGGVYVLANIRGGGEFGPDWHQAAIKEKRQTGFNDFIAVAKDLIHAKITSPEHLGIKGDSNGGLLVSVSMTQHPELLGAVVCEAPFVDMLRYTEFGAGPSWTAEYGDPKEAEMEKCLKGYSPIENISKDKKYPPMFVTNAENDQRVHPWHGRILHHLMEQHPSSENYYIESKDAGHGEGVDLKDRVDYYANIFTFLATTLGLSKGL